MGKRLDVYKYWILLSICNVLNTGKECALGAKNLVKSVLIRDQIDRQKQKPQNS